MALPFVQMARPSVRLWECMKDGKQSTPRAWGEGGLCRAHSARCCAARAHRGTAREAAPLCIRNAARAHRGAAREAAHKRSKNTTSEADSVKS
eukprot:355876-Chlamydomonas_euryale.AAC.2